MNYFDKTIMNSILIGGHGGNGTAALLALDNDAILGTQGNIVGFRFVGPPGNVHVHYVYFFLHAADAEGQNLTCDITAVGASTSRMAAVAIDTVDAAGGTAANKWIKFDFTGATQPVLTPNEVYWAGVYDKNGSGDGYQIRFRSSAYYTNASTSSSRLYGYTSTTGFTTTGTGVSNPHPIIIVFSNGTIWGFPYTQSVADASNTLERGIKFVPDENIELVGVQSILSSAMSTFQIYQGTTAPAGTPWYGPDTLLANEKALTNHLFSQVVKLKKGFTYRATFKYSSASTSPGYNEVEDAATPGDHALGCALGQGLICRTIDDGAGGWTDNNSVANGIYLPRMSLIVRAFIEGSLGPFNQGAFR